jgi:gamma-glutamyltranspeptidase / glutathione hydrolase
MLGNRLKIFLFMVISFLIAQPAFSAVKPVPARHGMVVSADRLASEVGVAVLREGGNAVDAAVAVGFALAVTYPAAGNIGGGGFLIYRRADGETAAYDFRETAPANASRDMYLDADGKVAPELSTVGALAVGTPGTVAGLHMAHRELGELPFARLVEPAIKLARDGFIVGPALAEQLAGLRKFFDRFPSTSAMVTNGEGVPQAGDRWHQPDLARTLERIRDKGSRGFYEGVIADCIVETMQKHSGLITHRDLAEYRPVRRKVISGTYKDVRILSMPPPSSGGVLLLQILGMLERWNLTDMGFGSSQSIHVMTEVMRRAYADRAKHLGDADYYDVPLTGLLDPVYLQQRCAGIQFDKASPSGDVAAGVAKPLPESEQTTHFSIVDAEGNAVAMTYTLNGSYGSKLVAEGAGFLLNNEMDDFSAKPGQPNMYGAIGSVANEIQPGKRMLSSMTPTIIERDGKLYMVTGSPGGTRIITTVMQVILNVVTHGMNVQQAVNAPRMHHQWLPDHIIYEPYGLSTDVRVGLQSMGHILTDAPRYMGDANSILVNPETGMRYGAPDGRTNSVAVGY